MSEFYILDGHEVIPSTIEGWAENAEKRYTNKEGDDSWRVDKTTLENGGYISTVFLGLDHSFGSGPPKLFETMYFPNHGDGTESWAEEDCERCATWEEAEAQHKTMVDKYK